MKFGLDIMLGEIFKRSFFEYYRYRSGDSSWDMRFNHANLEIVMEWDKLICDLGCRGFDMGERVFYSDFRKIIHPYRGLLIFVPFDLALRVKVLGYLPHS